MARMGREMHTKVRPAKSKGSRPLGRQPPSLWKDKTSYK